LRFATLLEIKSGSLLQFIIGFIVNKNLNLFLSCIIAINK